MDLKEFILDKLKPLINFGFEEITLDYSGGGDDGCIEDYEIKFSRHTSEDKRKEFEEIISDVGYEILNYKFPGWEISDGYVDGSSGQIVITYNQKGLHYIIHHGQNFINTEHTSEEEDIPYSDL